MTEATSEATPTTVEPPQWICVHYLCPYGDSYWTSPPVQVDVADPVTDAADAGKHGYGTAFALFYESNLPIDNQEGNIPPQPNEDPDLYVTGRLFIPEKVRFIYRSNVQGSEDPQDQDYLERMNVCGTDRLVVYDTNSIMPYYDPDNGLTDNTHRKD